MRLAAWPGWPTTGPASLSLRSGGRIRRWRRRCVRRSQRRTWTPRPAPATFLLWRTEQILKAGDDGHRGEAAVAAHSLTQAPGQAHHRHPHHRIGNHPQVTGARSLTAPFGELPAFAPGEVMQIDSDADGRTGPAWTTGVAGKVELTGMVDVATRTATAAVLRPATKAVDASVLLARTVTPELMRPGWV